MGMVGRLPVPMLRTLPILVVIAALLGGCTTQASDDDSTDKFRGDQRLAANAVEDFESAAKKGDQDKICRDSLSKELVAQLAQHGGNCPDAVDEALKDADTVELSVESVSITGANATVRAKVDRGKKDIVQSLTLVKQGAGWRISELAGR